MADELQSGICGRNWWDSSRGTFGSSPCSTAINDTGSFGWPTELVDIKARCTTADIESAGSVSDGPIVFQDPHRPQQPDSARRDTAVLMDSTLQMMGISLSSSLTMDWSQTLLSGRADESNYHHSMLQEGMNLRLNFKQSGMECPDQDQKEWVSSVGSQDSSLHRAFKPASQGFSDEPAGLNGSLTSSGGDSPGTCQQQALPTSFSTSPAASYVYPPTLLQTLFDSTLPDHQPQQPMFDKQLMNSALNFHPNLNHQIFPSPILKPSLQPTTLLHFTNDTPFWNASAANSLTPMQSQFFASTFEEKQPNCPNLAAKLLNGEVRESSLVAKKTSTEPAFKRARIETPSPLPTFKVRKEKLGDRITALQQLVSPFGKTDTASVLHEAIEYIKFLHDQVDVLSTPYMKNGAPVRQEEISSDKMKKPAEGLKQDLRSRGLCLVPISSTFPVANESATDFWTPTFGGTFR